MSIMGVLNTAVTGLFATQSALRTVSNNIVNVNTEGYARQVASMENIVVGGISAGVSVAEIERIVDRFLQAAGLDARARFAAAEAGNLFNGRFQGLLGRADSGSTITARLNRLFNVFADLALDPSGQILRQSTLASMQDLADEINRISGAIQDLRREASQQIQEQVFAVNAALSRIHALNSQIVRQRALGGEAAGLENRRDQALNDLAKSIDIRISRNSDGTIRVSTASGAVLLDSSLHELEYKAPGAVTSETLFNPIQIWRIDNLSGQRVGTVRDFDHQITAGTLRGLLDLRDDELRDMSLTLGELSAAVIDQINAIHNAHASVPPPNQMVGRNIGQPGGRNLDASGTVNFAIVDGNNLLVGKVTLNLANAANDTIDEMVNAVNVGLAGVGTMSYVNGVLDFAAIDLSHGVVIADDPNAPTDIGGRSLSHYFGMNDLLEAAVEVNYATGVTGIRTHNIAAGGQVIYEARDSSGKFLTQYVSNPVGATYDDILADLNSSTALGTYLNFLIDANGEMIISGQLGFEGVRLTVLSDTTDIASTGVSFTRLFGIGDRYGADRAKDVQVLSSINNSPSRMALASFDTTALLGNIVLSKGDQTGVLAFQALEVSVVQFDPAGELSNMSVSLGQYAATFYSNVGLKAARSAAQVEDRGVLLAEINIRIADVSGVNLDEELANMIVLQNSFNAAARLITTSQEMFDALLAAV